VPAGLDEARTMAPAAPRAPLPSLHDRPRLQALFVINGRFGAQRVSGVQRVAHGLLSALDAHEALPDTWQLLSPPDIEWPALVRIGLEVRTCVPVSAASGTTSAFCCSQASTVRRRTCTRRSCSVCSFSPTVWATRTAPAACNI